MDSGCVDQELEPIFGPTRFVKGINVVDPAKDIERLFFRNQSRLQIVPLISRNGKLGKDMLAGGQIGDLALASGVQVKICIAGPIAHLYFVSVGGLTPAVLDMTASPSTTAPTPLHCPPTP